jgi:hypothetical protein
MGFVSNTMPINEVSRFDFTVRAFDCLDDNSFTDISVHDDVIEPCTPEWKGIFLLFLYDSRV